MNNISWSLEVDILTYAKKSQVIFGNWKNQWMFLINLMEDMSIKVELRRSMKTDGSNPY